QIRVSTTPVASCPRSRRPAPGRRVRHRRDDHRLVDAPVTDVVMPEADPGEHHARGELPQVEATSTWSTRPSPT
ncbi:hypothetical protein, partial [Quisquiliibacterium transsilvanicum]|uniref:hypothetical protein n=1 Tax=Quisquiliibacterium transsilvanicum TaxID=1549638 RepID=UPI001C85E6D2